MLIATRLFCNCSADFKMVGGVVLDYLGGPSVITRALKNRKGGRREDWRDILWEELILPAGFEDRGRGHESRSPGGLRNLDRARKSFSLEAAGGHSLPAAGCWPVRPRLGFWRMISVCCFKRPSLQKFVTTAIGKKYSPQTCLHSVPIMAGAELHSVS